MFNRFEVGGIRFFETGGRVVAIENSLGDLGPQVLQYLFSHNARRGVPILDSSFSGVLLEVFEAVIGLEAAIGNVPLAGSAADLLYGLFTPFWEENRRAGQYSVAKGVWLELAALTSDAERGGGKIHRGTAYYFLATTYLDQMDTDAAFRLLHLAVEEDKALTVKAKTPATFVDGPAYKTVSLRDDRQNFLYDLVRAPRGRLDGEIATYNQRTGRNFTLQVFDKGFLQNADFDEETFSLSFFLAWTEKWALLTSAVSETDGFSPMARLRTYLLLTGIIEQLLKRKWTDRFFATNLFKAYATENHTSLDQANKTLGAFASHFGDWENDFPAALQAALDWKPGTGGPPDERWRAVVVVWQMRNHGAHQLEASQILSSRSSEIDSLLLSALFVAFEWL